MLLSLPCTVTSCNLSCLFICSAAAFEYFGYVEYSSSNRVKHTFAKLKPTPQQNVTINVSVQVHTRRAAAFHRHPRSAEDGFALGVTEAHCVTRKRVCAKREL